MCGIFLLRSYRFSSFRSPLEKYQYVRDLQERNEHLYHALIIQHLEEALPIIYTPTVGDACKQYSYMYNYGKSPVACLSPVPSWHVLRTCGHPTKGFEAKRLGVFGHFG